MSNFRPTDRQTGFLMPPSVDAWLPARHPARFVVATRTTGWRIRIGQHGVRQMQRCKSLSQAQGFLSAHAFIYGHFRPRRHRMTAANYRISCATAFRVWREETCARMAA
jgi:hypothetical protein